MVSSASVIWVAQWYPHEGEPYAGDFIQRHARAVALYQQVQVFACFPHTSNYQTNTVTGNLTETVIYFKPVKTGNKALNKILFWHKWKRLLQVNIRQYLATQGKPDLIHCHITLNAGWLSLWAKKKLGIPYLITEHWSGYMTGAYNGFDRYNRWSKKLFHKIIKGAICVTTVSEALASEMQRIEKQVYYIRIPNVVDEAIFYSNKVDEQNSKKKRLLHISTFSQQKNMQAMLAAFDEVANTDADFEFHIVGPKAKFQKLFPQQFASPYYRFYDEIPQQQIASLMQQCNACVLYSHYETFGCVIIEAHALGLPTIVSDIPVLREIVEDNQNGVLVPPNNSAALAKAIQHFFTSENSFYPKKISQQTLKQYSFSVVGKQFFDLYQSLLSSGKKY